jgi:hypothetical protein
MKVQNAESRPHTLFLSTSGQCSVDPSVFDHIILEENKEVAPGPPSVGAARLTPAIGGGAIWALLYRFIEFTSSCPARTVRAICMTERLLA